MIKYLKRIFRKRLTFAERRGIINNIPEGEYCYTIIGARDDFSYDIKCCPYWKSIGKHRAKCTLLNEKDKYPQSSLLLWDQVKCCRYNSN